MRLFYAIIVPLIWEGVNVVPSPAIVKNSDIQIGFVTQKRSKNARAMANYQRQSENGAENFMDSIVVAIDTGNLKNTEALAGTRKDDIINVFVKSLGEFVRNSVDSPISKTAIVTASKSDIKPEIVRMHGEKPSLILNLNSEMIINGLKDILRSKVAHRLVEKLSKDSGLLFPLVDE